MGKKLGSILRIVLGGYLVWIGVSLMREMLAQRPADMVFKMVMAGAFILIGAGYAIWAAVSAVSLFRKEMKEKQREEATEAAARKMEKRRERSKRIVRTAPMPAPSEIVKGMAKWKEEDEEAEKRE